MRNDEQVREFSGRKFSEEDITLIKFITKKYPKLSQTEMASTICEVIGWLTPNGKPKKVPCIEYLRRLEAEGLISLPAIRENHAIRKKRNPTAKNEHTPSNEIDMAEISSCGDVSLEIVRPGERLSQWRSNMSRYHVLGDPHVHGSQLRYMITSEGRDLGCLLFSASSWALSLREEWIGWTTEDKKQRLHLIVNNTRFLLFPWVRVKNLASRALSMAARQLQSDWLAEYCYAPVLLETFVDSPYKGTCYKASNWIYLGETKGRGRNDRYNQKPLTQKAIYMLPLQRDFRAVLKGEKPCKAVNPDDK